MSSFIFEKGNIIFKCASNLFCLIIELEGNWFECDRPAESLRTPLTYLHFFSFFTQFYPVCCQWCLERRDEQIMTWLEIQPGQTCDASSSELNLSCFIKLVKIVANFNSNFIREMDQLKWWTWMRWVAYMDWVRNQVKFCTIFRRFLLHKFLYRASLSHSLEFCCPKFWREDATALLCWSLFYVCNFNSYFNGHVIYESRQVFSLLVIMQIKHEQRLFG